MEWRGVERKWSGVEWSGVGGNEMESSGAEWSGTE